MTKNLSAPLFKAAALLFCVLCLLFARVCPAQTNINEFVTTGAGPTGITFGQDGAYWFVENGSGAIGRIDTVSNVFGAIAITNKPWCQPFDITAGPDNHLWFTEANNSIVGRLDPFTSNYIEFTLPFPTNAQPTSIITGPDSNIWFIEYALNRIAFISTNPATNASGTLNLTNQEFLIRTNSLPSAPTGGTTNSQLTGLAAGPDGNIWFVENNWGLIGRLSLNTNNFGAITEFTLPNTNCQPLGITKGADGALWFTEFNANKIGRMTTNGAVTEFNIPNPSGGHIEPYGIRAGQDGRIWFALFDGSAIGSITTNGIITLYPVPTQGGAPSFLATGNPAFTNVHDTNIWFTEFYGQRVARLLVGQSLSLSAPTVTSFTNGTMVSNLQAYYTNATGTNTVVVYWGDGTSNLLQMTNTFQNTSTNTNGLSITNLTGINYSNTNNFIPGTFVITASHTYAAVSNYVIAIAVTDSQNTFAVANVSLPPNFFDGQVFLGNQIDYLQFPDGTVFGYYSLEFYPYIYHFGLGWEYFIPTTDGSNGGYLYDFSTGHWFYTSPSLYPYLYDFTLNAWLYYFTNTAQPNRHFYNFATDQNITE